MLWGKPMRNIWLIARREYLERVRTKSFIVTTVLIPALMLGGIFGPALLQTRSSGGTKHLMVVASDGRTAELIRDQLQKMPEDLRKRAESSSDRMDRAEIPPTFNIVADTSTDTSDAARAAFSEKVKQKQLDGVIFATKDALAKNKVPFVTGDVSGLSMTAEIQRSVGEALHRDLLKSKGLSDQDVNNVLQPVKLDAQSPAGMGNPRVLVLAVLSMVMVLYGSTLWYGVAVSRAIVDEKTSRVMEIMLASARPTEMMAGKILGVGAVGLSQIAIWCIFASVPAAMGLIAMAGMMKGILSVKILVYFAVFFLLGYLLYSTLCAGVGSLVNSEQEAQQLQILVMLPMIISVFIMVNVLQSPASPTAFWASMFPLTAPLLMFLRIALQTPPVWQIALSIALMLGTTVGLVWLCGRIYRVGILMYGKRPTLPEIMKWIRYA
jgi:ABC-2 type transport system permease protein